MRCHSPSHKAVLKLQQHSFKVRTNEGTVHTESKVLSARVAELAADQKTKDENKSARLGGPLQAYTNLGCSVAEGESASLGVP